MIYALRQAPLRGAEVYIATAVVAFCSIVYELLLAQTLTVIFGGNVIRYSVTIGLYLFGLGLGAEFSRYLENKPARRFVYLEIVLSLLGALAVPLIFWLSQYQFAYEHIVFYGAHAMILLIGILSGAEIPLLVALAHKNNFYRVLSLDYYGALIGSVLFGVYLYSNVGLIATGILIAALNLGVALYFIARLPIDRGAIFIALIILLCLCAAWAQHQMIRDYLQEKYLTTAGISLQKEADA